MEDFTVRVRETKQHETEVLLKKHEDYGPKNIATSPGGPLVGIAVRLHDKLSRLAHLMEKGADQNNYESIEDTLLDIANYGSIGQLVVRGEWPGT